MKSADAGGISSHLQLQPQLNPSKSYEVDLVVVEVYIQMI